MKLNTPFVGVFQKILKKEEHFQWCKKNVKSFRVQTGIAIFIIQEHAYDIETGIRGNSKSTVSSLSNIKCSSLRN